VSALLTILLHCT